MDEGGRGMTEYAVMFMLVMIALLLGFTKICADLREIKRMLGKGDE